MQQEQIIVVRNLRFARKSAAARWWLDDNPFASAWFNALSLSFPRGEAMFIAAVKHFRTDAPADLAEQIRAFVQQEVNHTREHVAFNRSVADAGYDVAAIDARIARLVERVFERPPIVWLTVTTALEHFTAMFAHEFLARPEHFVGSATEQAGLWRWHAVEEIEHKAVAFDTWRHATRAMPRRRRYLLRTLIMIDVTGRFLRNRFRDALELLEQDGITGWRARRGLLHYVLVSPGVLRAVLPAWLAWFRPGFHPWDTDDTHLIARYESDQAAAGNDGIRSRV